MPDPEAENRQLRSELLRAREAVELPRERLAYALHQVAELRKRIPGTVTQAVRREAQPSSASRTR